MPIFRFYVQSWHRLILFAVLFVTGTCGSALAQVDPSAELADGNNPFTLHDLKSPNVLQDLVSVSGNEDYSPEALERLQYAAQSGNHAAKWRLGRIYADYAGREEDHLQAFRLFSEVAQEHDHDAPYTARAPYVANALYWLGNYYRDGIAGSFVKQDSDRALSMFFTAATVYGNRDAMFALSQMCGTDVQVNCSKRQASRWLKLAAVEGHVNAQAELGHRLFEGIGVKRKPVEGLKWLEIARLNTIENGSASLSDAHEAAFSLASDEQRKAAISQALKWVEKK